MEYQDKESREIELVEKMKKYWLELLGVGETKVRGNDKKVIVVMLGVFSGVQDGKVRAGVTILMSESLGRCLK